MTSERLTRPPSGQWWTINGADLMAAMRRCHDGEDPDLVYLEYIANSDTTDYGKGEE